MPRNNQPLLSFRADAPPGVALVVTLMMMSVLTMMVVGLAGVMRNEQAASRNLTYQVLADQLTEIGANQGIAAVLSNSPRYSGSAAVAVTDLRPMATGPGWLYAGGTNLIPLFQTNRGEGMVNLEEIGTNSLILGVPDGTSAGGPTWRGVINAGWSNLFDPGNANRIFGRVTWWVDDEGTKLNLNATGGTNLNGTALGSRTPLSPAFVCLNPLDGTTNSSDVSRNAGIGRRTNWLFSTEALKETNATSLTNSNTAIGGSVYRRSKGHITAWSSNLDLTSWGSRKLDLSQPTNQDYNTILSVLRSNQWNAVFGSNMTLARKYGGGSQSSTNQESRRTPAGAGELALQQIAANLLAAVSTNAKTVVFTNFFTESNDLATNRHRYLLPYGVATMSRSPMLEDVRVRVDATATNTTNVALRLAVRLQILNMDNVAKTNLRIDFQPRKFRFGVNLVANGFSATTISSGDVAGIVSTPLSVTDFQVDCSNNPTTGANVLWIGPEWYPGRLRPFSLSSRTITNLAVTLPPRSRFVFASLTNTITFKFNRNIGLLANPVPQCYVILDQILLREGTNIVDWVSTDDFAQDGNFYYGTNNPDNGQMNFTGVNAPLLTFTGLPTITTNESDWTGANVFQLRKIDPQVRRSVSSWNTNNNQVGVPIDLPGTARAWTRGNFDVTNTNGTVTGISYLWPDPAPGVTDVTNHPHFVDGFRPTNGLTSIAQLGAIHTGIPWRTLRLQPQPLAERTGGSLDPNSVTNFPPDWIVLELFSLTNQNGAPPTLPMINLNALGMMASSGGGTGTNNNPLTPFLITNTAGGGQSNPIWAWLGWGAAGIWRTNLTGTANNLIGQGMPISLTNATNAPYPGLASNNAAMLITNLVTALQRPTNTNGWARDSGWPFLRARATNLPTNGFVFRGELLEVAGFASETNLVPTVGEDILEGRLRGYLDLITTRSDTFSVWSIGQSLLPVTNAAGTVLRTNVMGEVRRQTVFQRVPMLNANGFVTNYQVQRVYTRNHVVE